MYLVLGMNDHRHYILLVLLCNITMQNYLYCLSKEVGGGGGVVDKCTYVMTTL